MTLITRFRNPVRAVLGAVTALDTDKQMYSDRAVDEAVKLVVETGLLPGYGLDTSVGGSVNDSVSPDVVSPGVYGLLVYQAARMFVARMPSHYSYGTRPMRESFGSFRELKADLDVRIGELRAMVDGNGVGVGLESWSALDGWLSHQGVSVAGWRGLA